MKRKEITPAATQTIILDLKDFKDGIYVLKGRVRHMLGMW